MKKIIWCCLLLGNLLVRGMEPNPSKGGSTTHPIIKLFYYLTGAEILKPRLLRALQDDLPTHTREEVVRVLLQDGCPVNFGSDQEMPLLIASRNGHEEIVKMLLEAGAFVDYRTFKEIYRNQSGRVPSETGFKILSACVKSGVSFVPEMRGILRSYLTQQNLIKLIGNHPLVKIILDQTGEKSLGKFTIHRVSEERSGANTQKELNELFIYAAACGLTTLIETLMENQAFERDLDSTTMVDAFHAAVRGGHLDIVKKLLPIMIERRFNGQVNFLRLTTCLEGLLELGTFFEDEKQQRQAYKHMLNLVKKIEAYFKSTRKTFFEETVAGKTYLSTLPHDVQDKVLSYLGIDVKKNRLEVIGSLLEDRIDHAEQRYQAIVSRIEHSTGIPVSRAINSVLENMAVPLPGGGFVQVNVSVLSRRQLALMVGSLVLFWVAYEMYQVVSKPVYDK